MTLIIFLIGLCTFCIIFVISLHYAYQCDMICHAYEVLPKIFDARVRHEQDIYYSLGQQGVTFTCSEFRAFVAKLIETHRIEATLESPLEHDTFTLPGSWYRRGTKHTHVARLYDHNTTD